MELLNTTISNEEMGSCHSKHYQNIEMWSRMGLVKLCLQLPCANELPDGLKFSRSGTITEHCKVGSTLHRYTA